MREVINELNNILFQIPSDNFYEMIAYVTDYYKEDEVDDQFLIDFFENSNGTGIWYDLLENCLSKLDYKMIMDLENSDWERADYISYTIGKFVIENFLKDIK